MKKLYTVTIETEIVVLAEGEVEAEEVARRVLRDIDDDAWCSHAQPMRYWPGEWDEDALPYEANSEEDVTIGELIASGAAPELKEQS